jgi:hypothetical protein
MFGSKARRIAELEEALGKLERTHKRQTVMVRDMRAKIVRQRQALREQQGALKRDRAGVRGAADLGRLAIAGMTDDYPGAARHDGNHPADECEACRAFLLLGSFATNPWHRVIRARGLRAT